MTEPDDHTHVGTPAGAGQDAESGSVPALSPAAQRALAEAEARRADIDARAAEIARVREENGRGGKEPVRYDDWEVRGIAVDF